MIAAEDGSWLEQAQRRRPGRAGRRTVGGGGAQGRMRVIVTRPRAQAGPLVERLEELGFEVVECPLIEIERTSDEPIDCARLRMADRHEPERRRRDRPSRGRTCRRSRPSGLAPPRRSARTGSSPTSSRTSRPRTGCSPSSRGRTGRVLFAAAENSRRGPIDALGADFVPLYRDAPALARARRQATSSCSRPARRRAPMPGSVVRRRP